MDLELGHVCVLSRLFYKCSSHACGRMGESKTLATMTKYMDFCCLNKKVLLTKKHFTKCFSFSVFFFESTLPESSVEFWEFFCGFICFIFCLLPYLVMYVCLRACDAFKLYNCILCWPFDCILFYFIFLFFLCFEFLCFSLSLSLSLWGSHYSNDFDDGLSLPTFVQLQQQKQQ